MKIQLVEKREVPCQSCYKNYADYVIHFGSHTESFTTWRFLICDPCLKELKAIEYPTKPRYEAVPSSIGLRIYCHSKDRNGLDTKPHFVYDHQFCTTVDTGGPYCKSCAEAVAKVLNEAQ